MLAQGLAQQWGELRFPCPHRFVGKDHAPLQEHFCEISEAQLVPHAPQHDEAHHIGGILQMVEACTGPLIEFPLTSMTPKASVAECSSLPSLSCVSRLTVWTPHHPLLLDANVYPLPLSKTRWG